MVDIRMVSLTTVRSSFEAKVLTARLGADGIVWQVSGNLDSIYPLGLVEVRVAEDDLERAREVLGTVDGDGDDDVATSAGGRGAEWLVAAALVALVVIFVGMRLLAAG